MMTRFTLQRGGFVYVYRIGKRKAEYYRYINGDLDTFNDELTSTQAEQDIEELKRSGFSCSLGVKSNMPVEFTANT